MAKRVTDKIGVPAAIIINRSTGEDELIEEYAESIGLPIIGRLPFSMAAAQAIAHGELLAQQPQWHARFAEIGRSLEELLACSF